MPDFRTCTLVWGGGHALQRARERSVDLDAVEANVRGSTDLEPGIMDAGSCGVALADVASRSSCGPCRLTGASS